MSASPELEKEADIKGFFLPRRQGGSENSRLRKF
jgi:hypothetical protein